MQILSFISLTRPLNLLITFGSAVLAYLLATGQFGGGMVLAGAAAALIAAGGNIINDIFDIETDRINKPERALASGRISLNAAAYFYFTLSLAGLTCAVLISYAAFAIAFMVFAGLFLYAKKLKRIPLAGNFLVSFFTGLVFPFGALAGGDISAGYFPFAFAFLATMIREIVKDAEDVEGDTAAGLMTYPVKEGITSAVRMIKVFSVLLILSTTLPVIMQVYKIEFFILVMLIANPLVVMANKQLHKTNPEKSDFSRASLLMKFSMLGGITAIAAGKF